MAGRVRNNIATGLWHFYYPDGKPEKIIEINPDQVRILHTWNEKGREVIKNGEGKFVLDDYLPGFNEIGYSGISYSGKVKNGVPEGSWAASYIFPKDKRELIYSEQYKEGRLVLPFGGLPLNSRQLKIAPRIRLLPTEYYVNAENLTSKRCSIDDNSGFTIYLGKILNDVFNFARINDEHVEKDFKISLAVNEKGQGFEMTITPKVSTAFDTILFQMLSNIPYWIPSQINGKLVSDTLIIQTAIAFDEQNVPSFSLPVITRLTGK